MIKGSIQEEDIMIVNIYEPDIGAPQYIWQTLSDKKREIDGNTIIVEHLNTPLTATERSSKHKINKEAQVLNNTLDEMNFIDIFRIFNSKWENKPSQLHMTHHRIHHILGHK